jgi:hypothetical protein
LPPRSSRTFPPPRTGGSRSKAAGRRDGR